MGNLHEVLDRPVSWRTRTNRRVRSKAKKKRSRFLRRQVKRVLASPVVDLDEADIRMRPHGQYDGWEI